MIPSLHGLRAVSILMVLLGHTVICAGYESWWLYHYTWAGVLVFFVISGYLITTLMLREVEETGSLSVRGFYARRAWRILPVAYGYLLIITVLRWSEFSWTDIGFSWGYLSQVGMLFPSYPWDLSHLWSLSVEEMFYLGWPLILAASLTWARRTAWAAVLLAPLCRYYFHHEGWEQAAQFSFPGVVDSVATGALIAFNRQRLISMVSQFRWAGVIWLVAAISPLLLLMSSSRFLWPLPQFVGHCVWSLFNISVGLGMLWAIAWRPAILNNWMAVWLGTISYSLYIWHMPLMNPAAQIPFPLNIILALVAAAASYYLLEAPVLRLSKSLRDQGRRGEGGVAGWQNSQAVILPSAPGNVTPVIYTK